MNSLKSGPWKAAPLCLAASLALTGCTSLLGGDAQRSDSDLAEVKRRIVELQEQAAVAQVELDRLRREVAELQAARGYAPRGTEGGAEPVARAVPETRAVQGSWPGGLATGAASGDRPGASGAVAVGGIEASDLEAPRPVPQPVGRAAPEPPSPIEVISPRTPAPVPSAEIPPAAQALYDEGYTLYHQGRYLDAEAVFQRFLAQYGSLELTDNALYWIGECRYARGDFEGALASFQETVTRFPDGNKVPAALLKSGRCFESLGDFASAKRSYEQVIDRFPDDSVAAIARQRVGQIR